MHDILNVSNPFSWGTRSLEIFSRAYFTSTGLYFELCFGCASAAQLAVLTSHTTSGLHATAIYIKLILGPNTHLSHEAPLD